MGSGTPRDGRPEPTPGVGRPAPIPDTADTARRETPTRDIETPEIQHHDRDPRSPGDPHHPRPDRPGLALRSPGRRLPLLRRLGVLPQRRRPGPAPVPALH